MPCRLLLPTLFILLGLTAIGRAETPRPDSHVWLNMLLKKEAPVLSVLPTWGNSIILRGPVKDAEQVRHIMKLARRCGVARTQIVNALVINPQPMILLEIVVANLAISEMKRGAEPYRQWQQFRPSSAGNPVALATFAGDERQRLLAFVQELRGQEMAKILAMPNLVSMSGRPAYYNSGGSVAVPKLDESGKVVGETWTEFGTTVECTPTVLPDGHIYLELGVSVVTLDPAAGIEVPGWGAIPGRLQQAFRTSVILDDGQTFVLGGLLSANVRKVLAKHPVLGDLALLGCCFNSVEYLEVEEEGVILATVTVVKPD